jgi:hypothetical protein
VGDEILAVDGSLATRETLNSLLLGKDIPNTKVVLTLCRGPNPRTRAGVNGGLGIGVLGGDISHLFGGKVEMERDREVGVEKLEVELRRMASQDIGYRRHVYELFKGILDNVERRGTATDVAAVQELMAEWNGGQIQSAACDALLEARVSDLHQDLMQLCEALVNRLQRMRVSWRGMIVVYIMEGRAAYLISNLKFGWR